MQIGSTLETALLSVYECLDDVLLAETHYHAAAPDGVRRWGGPKERIAKLSLDDLTFKVRRLQSAVELLQAMAPIEGTSVTRDDLVAGAAYDDPHWIDYLDAKTEREIRRCADRRNGGD